MRKTIFCFIAIFLCIPLSACGRNELEKTSFSEKPLGRTEQYRSTQEVDTVNRDKTIKVEPDKGKFLSEQEEGIKLDTEVETVTSEEAYALVLDEFRDFCADTSERGNYSIDGTVASDYHTYDAILYYSYYDVDKNGILELLLSMGSSDDIGGIVDLYGFNGSEAVCIQGNDTLGDRSRLTIYTDGTIYREDSGGADNGKHTFYRLATNGFELEEIEKYIYDNNKKPEPFFNNSKSLTEDEFYALIDENTVISDIEWHRLEVEERVDDNQLYEAFLYIIKNEQEVYFCQDDFDCDGQEEAFGITGIEEFSDLKNVRIYYISSDAKVSCIDEIPAMYGYGDSYFLYPDVENLVVIDASYVKFLSLGGIDGQVVRLYGVKNGSAYQPEISGKFCEFVIDEENSKRYCAYESNDGGEEMEIYEYDVDNQEFVSIFTEKN